MNYKHSIGYTLIELMIVVAIVGILSTVAFGFYRDNVIASNRAEGRSVLSEVAASLEKCKSLYGAYNSANCNVADDVSSDTNYYEIDTTASITATTFTLTATPVSGQPQASDTDCTSLTLTNTGIKGGSGADSSVCW
jgi:type IV pilus assembly protein PilE